MLINILSSLMCISLCQREGMALSPNKLIQKRPLGTQKVLRQANSTSALVSIPYGCPFVIQMPHFL